MTERAPTQFMIQSMRIGRTDLGAGTITVEDDALVLTLGASPDDRPLVVPLATVDVLTDNGVELLVATHDGTRLALSAGGPQHTAAVRAEIVERCRAIPELTRALRAFGSRRGHGSARASGPAEQRRFFAPLLDARREAVAASDPDAALRAFDAVVLGNAIQAALESFATERHGENAPARRALEAELVDLIEPLRDALGVLAEAAQVAAGATDDLRLWRVWSNQLGRMFEVADRVWLSVDGALDAVTWRA